MKMPIILSALTTVAATAALAQPDLPRPTTAPAASDKGPVICEVRLEPGSRLGRRRICMTEASWKIYRRESHHWTERVQDRRSR